MQRTLTREMEYLAELLNGFNISGETSILLYREEKVLAMPECQADCDERYEEPGEMMTITEFFDEVSSYTQANGSYSIETLIGNFEIIDDGIICFSFIL